MKTIHLIMNWLPLPSPIDMPYLKDYPHNLTKYESKEASKIPVSNLIFRNPIFPSFMNWKSLRRATPKNVSF